MRLRAVTAAAALYALAPGCEQPTRALDTCVLTPGQVVASHPGLGFDGIALGSMPDGKLAAIWSDPSGLWLRSLGAPSTAPTRLGERCQGGVALATGKSPAGSVLGCVRRTEAGGEALVLELGSDGAVQRTVPLGEVGRDGRGIALAVDGANVLAAFHEGSVGRHAVHLATLRAGVLSSDERISHVERPSSSPALLSQAGRRYAAWSEMELEANGESRAQIWVMQPGSAPKKVAESSVTDPTPTLAFQGAELWVGFRDKRGHDKRSELYVVALSSSLTALRLAQRVGRANGEGAPQLRVCGNLRAAVLPREYGSELYVALHPLDSALHNLGGGHQYYANSREFVLADAVCAGNGLDLLIAERAAPSKPGVEALSLSFRCQ